MIALLVFFSLAATGFSWGEADWDRWPEYMKPRAEYVNFWRPYQPGPNTVALFHFDQPELTCDDSGGKSSLLLSEQTCSAPGKFKEGLKLQGKPTILKLGVSLFEKDRFLIEFWLKLERLPAKEKFLFSRAQLHGSQNGLFLTLLPDGSLCYRQVSSRVPDYHPEQPISPSLSRFVRQVSAPAGTIKPGQWHHLSVYAGGFMAFPSGDRISLWVDGKELGRLDYGWYLEKENQPTELQLGDEDFVCSLDELRIMTGVWRKYYPWPDDSFTDPERKRTLEKRIEFVAPENDICFQASFEGSLQPEKAAPGIRPLVKDQVSFAPGVRGQAVLLPGGSSVSYPVKDNLSLSQGSVEMWFKPLGWAGDHRPQQSFFTISDNRKQTRWFWYITNCGYMSPTAIFGGSSSPGSGNGYVEYPPDTWTHLLLTWNGSTCKLFVNGKLTVSSLSRHRFDEDFSPGYFTLPSGGPALVDELFIYRRDLSPEEAGNHYSRYFAHGELKRVGSGRDLGSITYSDFPGAGKIKVNLHFFRPLPENTRIEISLTTQGKEVVKQSFALSPDSQYLVSGVPYHPGKNLSLTVRCFDRTSKLLGQMSTPFHRPDFPWLGNSIGLTRKVLKPWTPMEVVGKTVRVVGRSHLLAGTGLFASLEDFGEEILAGPMRIEIVSGKTTLQAIPASKLSFTRQAAHQVRWKSSAVAVLPSGRLLFHISAEMDYDGSTKFTIEYMPEKGNLPLEGLTLIVPLKNEFVKTFSTVGSAPAVDNWKDSDGVLPDQPGVVFQSSDLFGRWKMTLGNFLPMLWIGNDERGLAYMADNDRGWFPSDRYPAITIYRHPHAAEWRFHFISEPVTLSGKREIVFGLQATPVRPLPENWRGYCFHVPGLKLKLPDDFPRLPWGSFLSDAAGWDEGGVLDYPYNPEKTRQVIENLRQQGLKATPHLDTAYLNWGWKKDTYRYFQEEWSSGGVAYNQIFCRSKIDWCLESQRRWKEEFGIDGVYYDTGTLRPNYNTISGTAYLLPDGRIQPGWCVWGQREYFQRSAHLFGNPGETNFTWGNGFYGPQISGWQLGVVVGEQPPRKPGIDDYGQVSFPFEKHRLHAVSYKWGLIRLWQPPPDPYRGIEEDRKFIRSFYAQLLQFDCRTAFTSFGLPLSLAEFGVYRPGIVFYPFWKNSEILSTSLPSGIIFSCYRDGQRLLLLTSNRSPETKEVVINLGLRKLGLEAFRGFLTEDPEEREKPMHGEPEYVENYRWLRGGRCLLPPEELSVAITSDQEKLSLRFRVAGKDYRVLLISPVP